MARKPPKRVGPPTPRLSQRQLRQEVEAIRQRREAAPQVKAAKRARKAQIQGDALSVARRLLEEQTGVDWRARREKPVRYWDERWELEATRARASYEELHEWLFAIQTNRTVSGHLSGRTVSIMVRVDDGGQLLTFTAASARDFTRAMDEMDGKLQVWAERYGRDADEEYYSRVVEVVVFVKRGAASKRWKSQVAGRAAEREKRRLRSGRDF